MLEKMFKKKQYLGLNPARLNITNNLTDSISFSSQSLECDKCKLRFNRIVKPGRSAIQLMNTIYGTEYSIKNNNTGAELCFSNYSFDENSQYSILVHYDGNKTECLFDEPIHGENIYLPLLWASLSFFVLFLVWQLIRALRRTSCLGANENERLIVTDLGSPDESTATAYVISAASTDSVTETGRRRRLRSLDAFRGFAMILMIFVNTGGGKYWFFQHSDWNGLTIADVVFPWFMWIMGVSMVLSLHTKLRCGVPKRKILLKIVIRSATLFLIGIILNCKKGYTFDSLRIPGVLQRFAIAYLLAGVVDVLFTRANDVYSGPQNRYFYAIRDLLFSWPQWLYIVLLIVTHTALTFYLPVPGCGRGYLGPGGLHLSAEGLNKTFCTGGAAGYIDRQMLGESHLYSHSSCQAVYNTMVRYDPEGLLGSLTATFLVFLGLQAGKILVFHSDQKARMIRWIIWGIVLIAIALSLNGTTQNDGLIPVNKNMWSLSFVLLNGGLAFLLLPIFYYVIDVVRYWSGTPFYYAGMNSILLYIGSELLAGYFPWEWYCSATHACYLAKALWCTSLWVVISIYLYYKNFFLAI